MQIGEGINLIIQLIAIIIQFIVYELNNYADE